MNMTNTRTHQDHRVPASGALFLAIVSPVLAQEKPFMQPGTGQIPLSPPPPPVTEPAACCTNAAALCANPLEKLFGVQIPGAIANGKFNFNVRARYEQDDADNLAAYKKNSYAPTVRTRFGFTTAPLYGFQGMLEAVNISVLGP